MLLPVRIHLYELQGDHSPDNVKFPDISPTVRSTPPLHSCCALLQRVDVFEKCCMFSCFASTCMRSAIPALDIVQLSVL